MFPEIGLVTRKGPDLQQSTLSMSMEQAPMSVDRMADIMHNMRLVRMNEIIGEMQHTE